MGADSYASAEGGWSAGYESSGSGSRSERKTITRPVAFLAGVALTAGAVGAPLGLAYWNHERQINNLKSEQNYEIALLKKQQTINHVQAVLGASGVRFNRVELQGKEELVSIPGTGQNCETVTFKFGEDQHGGWNLSFEQKDAAGHVFDTPHASSAQGVENLVQDLCSNN